MNAIIPYQRPRHVAGQGVIALHSHAPSTRNVVHNLDALEFLNMLPEASVHCAVTSPPYYGLRSYLEDNHPDKEAEIGLEETPEQYIARLVEIFTALHRVLHPSGSLWLNLGDSYWTGKGQSGHASFDEQVERLNEGSTISQPHAHMGGKGRTIPKDRPHEIYKPKDLMLMPFRVALALQQAGWWLRSAIPWVKPNGMPESVADRPTTSHEYLFLFTKSKYYYADPDAVRLPNADVTLRRVQYGRRDNHKYANDGGHYPAGSIAQSLARPVADMRDQINPSGRNIRTSDWWNTSLDEYEAQLQAQLNHVRHVRKNGGMLLDEYGMPCGLMVSTKHNKFAHFATFPQDLIEPCIKFSCPEKTCSICGNPYERITESQSASADNARDWQGIPEMPPHRASAYFPKKLGSMGTPERTYHGWQPTCPCNADTSKGIVLDMFGGSGTTAVVARDNFRDYIINELNPEYVDIIRERLRLPNEKPVIEITPDPLEELPLFAALNISERATV